MTLMTLSGPSGATGITGITGGTGPGPIEMIAIRLADEGIPLRAIVRSTRMSSEDVRATLHEAIEQGTIVQMPREDWTPGVTRDDRMPGAETISGIDDDLLTLHLVRLFKVTKLQSALLLPLIKRREMTREAMHQIIESRREPNSTETDTKMVDVVICHLRKRLRPQQLSIKTIWSCGYYMPLSDRQRAVAMLGEFVLGHQGTPSLKSN